MKPKGGRNRQNVLVSVVLILKHKLKRDGANASAYYCKKNSLPSVKYVAIDCRCRSDFVSCSKLVSASE